MYLKVLRTVSKISLRIGSLIDFKFSINGFIKTPFSDWLVTASSNGKTVSRS